MDLAAGKKFAKLPEDDGRRKSESLTQMYAEAEAARGEGGPTIRTIELPEEASGAAAVDLPVTAGDVAAAEEFEAPFSGTEEGIEMAKRVLSALPEPEPDIVAAMESNMPKEELDELIAKVWKRRQSELKQFMQNNVADEARDMQLYLAALANFAGVDFQAPGNEELPEMSLDAVASRLEDLEWLVTQIDNAGDFVNMRGLDVMAALLRSEAREARFGACWVMGTAVKYQIKSQTAAIQGGLLPLVLEVVQNGVAEGDAGLAKKGIYALGAITRGCEDCQGHFSDLLAKQFPSLLTRATAATTDASVVAKMETLLSDLCTDSWHTDSGSCPFARA